MVLLYMSNLLLKIIILIFTSSNPIVMGYAYDYPYHN